jgi:beta-lactamase regulating signal transducer with metallopeptidase domain
MLINLYNQLFVMSIVAGGLYLILKIFSMVTTKYFKASWHYYTYIAVYMFLLLPYHKFISLFSFNQEINTKLSLPVLPDILRSSPSSSNNFIAVADNAESVPTLNLDFLPYLLIAGTLVFIAIILIQNIKLHRRIFEVCHLTNEVQLQEVLAKCKQQMGMLNHVQIYISPYASTPFLYGVFKPRIVLPEIEFTADELRYIFQHELTHWKRHDAWLKCLMLLINAIHWFNPLAYMARYDIDRFCELSCDESVVNLMGNEERRRYCKLMLGVLWNVTGHNVKLFSAFSDKRKQLERRMNMIMKFDGLKGKKKTRIFAFVMTLALLVAGSVTAYAATGNTADERTESANAATVGKVLGIGDTSGLKVYTEKLTEEEIANLKTLDSGKSNGEIIPYVSGSLSVGSVYNGSSYNLGVGSTIATSASWTPTSQSLDVGYVNNGTFTYVRFTGGSGSHTFTISKEGSTQIRVRNPSTNSASVNFTLDYVVD